MADVIGVEGPDAAAAAAVAVVDVVGGSKVDEAASVALIGLAIAEECSGPTPAEMVVRDPSWLVPTVGWLASFSNTSLERRDSGTVVVGLVATVVVAA